MNITKRHKLVLSIRSLNRGGAEAQFIELTKHIDKTKFDIVICTMYGGELEGNIKHIENIKYYNLQKKSRYDLINFLRNYLHIIKKEKAHLIYSFLPEMNIFSLLIKYFLSKKTRVIWGFRASNVNFKEYGKFHQILFLFQRILSRYVDFIISNSYASVEFHRTSGFDMRRSITIHNGIDTQRFKKNLDARYSFRLSHGLTDKDIAIGTAARIDPMKGYIILAEAAKMILEEFPDTYFFSAGDGDEKIKLECLKILEGKKDRFIWLGEQKEMVYIYSGWDIMVSSSCYGEGFSNSIAEAMSCEIPCVVTDVGDSNFIVKDSGIIVKHGNAKSLYEALKKMIITERRQVLGQKARDVILKNFSINNMVKKTEDVITSFFL